MRNTLIGVASIAVCAVFAATPAHAQAETLQTSLPSELLAQRFEAKIEQVELISAVTEKQPEKEQKDKKVRYEIQANETLTDIAKRHKTTWQRLYYKNAQINHPDEIKPGDSLEIPEENEKLKERPLPVAAPAPVTRNGSSNDGAQRTERRTATRSRARSMPRASSAGNTYSYGYCTWYVKNRRPDIPNMLGNANTWVSRAAAMGLATGKTPRVGAVGQQGMHVVYVEKVHSNGTVTVSEMNFKGWNVISSRTVAASNFTYIY